jgi:uncharacterized glyoxalase superfamily protein PhnB
MKQIEFILYISDQSKSRDFYKNVLQRQPSLDVDGMTEFQLSDNCKLGLMPEKGIVEILKDKTPNPESGNGIPRCELYLQVDNNIEEYFKRAIDSGAKEISGIQLRDWGDTVAYVADLDGHIIAFAKSNP